MKSQVMILGTRTTSCQRRNTEQPILRATLRQYLACPAPPLSGKSTRRSARSADADAACGKRNLEDPMEMEMKTLRVVGGARHVVLLVCRAVALLHHVPIDHLPLLHRVACAAQRVRTPADPRGVAPRTHEAAADNLPSNCPTLARATRPRSPGGRVVGGKGDVHRWRRKRPFETDGSPRPAADRASAPGGTARGPSEPCRTAPRHGSSAFEEPAGQNQARAPGGGCGSC
jgi:hypothetical protein